MGGDCCDSIPPPISYNLDRSKPIVFVDIDSVLVRRQEPANAATTDTTKPDNSETDDCSSCTCYSPAFEGFLNCPADVSCCDATGHKDLLLPREDRARCESCMCAQEAIDLVKKYGFRCIDPKCCLPETSFVNFDPPHSIALDSSLSGEQENPDDLTGTHFPKMADSEDARIADALEEADMN